MSGETAGVAVRTLLVDDEPLARENLRLRLREESGFEIVGECANGPEAIAAIRKLRPDLLFLDIQMPGMNGFEVIDRISPEDLPVVIFVTAYDRYALDAFRVHALDYLLKPVEDERFADALRIARERIAEGRRGGEGEQLFQVPNGQARFLDRLVIKARGRVFFLRTEQLDWIEADGDYSRLHAGDRSYLLRRTMNELESRLDPAAFVRVNRSAIVPLDRIEELTPESRGEYLVRLAGGIEVKLTRAYRDKLEGVLGDRL